jgi:hypothetical protein
MGVRCEPDLSAFEYSPEIFSVSTHYILHSTIKQSFQSASGPHYISLLGGISC